MKMLHFGAGKIGRGLIFPFFRRQHDITLADRNTGLVRAIQENKGYRLIELDYDEQYITNIANPPIRNFSELSGITDLDVITTSVITSNLVEIAPYICEIARNNKRPLYVIPMENSLEAADILKRELVSSLRDIDGIYFLGSVIDRIVHAIKNEFDVECEKYYSVKIENRHGFGDLLKDESDLVENIHEEFDKKFLLVNGIHACAAYLGYLRGHEYICDVMNDESIRRKLDRISECYMQYLISVYGCQEDDLARYINNSLIRFANPSIKDPLSRVGRNLLIKLSPNDRIYRPLLFNKHNRMNYEPLEEVVDAAKYFKIANDYEDYLLYVNKVKSGAILMER
jgi:mannitol-1-phosphate 5-dehydrogenase